MTASAKLAFIYDGQTGGACRQIRARYRAVKAFKASADLSWATPIPDFEGYLAGGIFWLISTPDDDCKPTETGIGVCFGPFLSQITFADAIGIGGEDRNQTSIFSALKIAFQFPTLLCSFELNCPG
jgi:hypothetical protein